jgi:hypothetical protein
MIDETDDVVMEQPAQEAAQEPQVDQQAVEKRAEEMYQARNFKMLREQADSNARRAEAAEREAYALRQRYESQGQQQAPQLNIGDDDIVEGKHLAQQKAYIDKKTQDQQNEISELKSMLTEYHIRTQCPDFDAVVTGDNLKKLAEDYPEIAATINSSQDMKSKAISAYKLIKKLDIGNNQSQLDKDRIASNLNKPKPSNALPKSESDLTRANAFERGITDSEREAIYKRTRDYARQG